MHVRKDQLRLDQLEDIVFSIEKELRRAGNSEVKSEEVGEKVMDKLAEVDEVAYVRFASVYRQFKDITVFIEELKEIHKKESNIISSKRVGATVDVI